MNHGIQKLFHIKHKIYLIKKDEIIDLSRGGWCSEPKNCNSRLNPSLPRSNFSVLAIVVFLVKLIILHEFEQRTRTKLPWTRQLIIANSN